MSRAAAPRARGRVPFAEAVRNRNLQNGARIFVLENHFNPTVSVSGTLHAGTLFAPPDRRLIATVTAGELVKGTQKRTKLEIAEELESRGASLSFSADSSDPVGTDVAGSSLSRDLDVLLDALAEILRFPVFPEEELEKERKRLVGGIRQQQDQTSVRAWEAATRRIYPPEHPLHRRPGEERIALVEALRREDLARFHGERYGAGTLILAVVGDVESDRVLDGLERRLGDWAPGPPADFSPPAPPPPVLGEERVEMPDKASADVVLAQPATLVRRDPDYLACTLANSALGQSSLTSRLGVRVRDVEGLTYGIHSSFSATYVAGPFVVTLTVRPEARDAAVAATFEEIERFLAEGISEKELAEEKSSRIGRFQVDLAANSGIAQAVDTAVYYGFGVEYLDEFPARVAAITREEADAAFRARVHPGFFTVVSAGSFAGTLEPGPKT